MDCATIDSFKLNRFELFFYYFHRYNFLNRSGVRYGISDLVTIAIALVVAAVILGVGNTVLSTINETISVSNVSGSEYGMTGLVTMAEFVPIIAIVAVAAVVIGIVMAFVGGRESSEPIPKNKKKDISTKEIIIEQLDKDYYKAEPDFDDVKKSWIEKKFGFMRYKK